MAPITCSGDPLRSPTRRDVALLAEALRGASNPIIVAGQGIHYAQAWAELRELAELVQIPVMTTQNGKSAFPENHSLALGAGGASRPDTVVHFIDKADLIVGLGNELHAFRLHHTVPRPVSASSSSPTARWDVLQGLSGGPRRDR